MRGKEVLSQFESDELGEKVLPHLGSFEADVHILFNFKREGTCGYIPREVGEKITKADILQAVECIRRHCDRIEKECE